MLTKTPLSQADRELIANVIACSDFPQQVTASQVVTIRIVDDVVWVQLYKCWVAFDFTWFKTQVAQLKPEPIAIAA